MFRQCLPLLPWRRLQGQRWWQWWWVGNFQCSDSSSVSSGCCKSVTVQATKAAAEKWPWSLGRYEVTGEQHEGAAVYRKSGGDYLYRHSDGTWRVSPWIGSSPSIKSVGTAECPTRVSQWQYSDFTLSGSVWYSGAITAQCS